MGLRSSGSIEVGLRSGVFRTCSSNVLSSRGVSRVTPACATLCLVHLHPLTPLYVLLMFTVMMDTICVLCIMCAWHCLM